MVLVIMFVFSLVRLYSVMVCIVLMWLCIWWWLWMCMM